MLTGLVSIAGAESTASTLPIKVELDFSKYQFTAPEEITVTIRVTNVTDEKFTSPVSVLDPNGSIIEAFGTPLLDAGASQSCTIAWNVTQADLNAGQLAFRVRYPRKDENGIVSNASNNFVKRISQVQAEPEIQVSRTITPGIARKGQEVSVVYEIRNVGTVDVTGVRIKESSAVSSNTASIGAIPAGEKKSHTFTVTMGTKNKPLAKSVKKVAVIGAIAAISDKLRNRFYPALKERYGIGRFAESYALTFLYAASSGASHSAQYALAAMFKAAADGKLDFVGHTREYAHRAHRVKELFERHGFHIVYDKDQDEHVSDGFFFTVGYGSMPSSDLVAALLRYGICAISLTSTGSLQNGVRVCVSQMNREEQYDLLDRRLRDFAQDYARK